MRLLEGQGLTHRFGGLIALQDVNFYVEAGEIVGLIGPNASGKTTLFDILAGRLRPTAGQVIFAGENVTGRPAHVISRMGLGRTFQIVRPFPDLSALDSVATGAAFARGERDLGRARELARRALERVGLAERAEAPARTLSLGQLKLLELARALAVGPRLLLLDEVGAGLSPAAGVDLRALLLELCAEGVTIFGIEHSPRAVAEIADRVYALDRGKVIAEGPPAAVLNDERVIEAYLGE